MKFTSLSLVWCFRNSQPNSAVIPAERPAGRESRNPGNTREFGFPLSRE
jgi:hypothetical protein